MSDIVSHTNLSINHCILFYYSINASTNTNFLLSTEILKIIIGFSKRILFFFFVCLTCQCSIMYTLMIVYFALIRTSLLRCRLRMLSENHSSNDRIQNTTELFWMAISSLKCERNHS